MHYVLTLHTLSELTKPLTKKFFEKVNPTSLTYFLAASLALASAPVAAKPADMHLSDEMNTRYIHFAASSPLPIMAAGIVPVNKNVGGQSLFARGSYGLTYATRNYIDNLAKRMLAQPGDSIKGISVTGSCSPDGSSSLNDRLALNRAHAVALYLSKRLHLSEQSVECHSIGENWALFRSLVESNSGVPWREQLLKIIDSDISPDAKERNIKALDKGRVWSFLLKDIFPALRMAEIRIDFTNKSITETIPDQTIGETNQPELGHQSEPEPKIPDSEPEISNPHTITEEYPAQQPQLPSPEEEPLHAYVKTNIPAWGLLWINAAGEIDVAPHWSANLSIYYSGFNYFKHTRKFRTFTVMPEMRYWFRRDNQGFFVAPHFGLGWYNCAFGGDYRYQDHNRRTPAIGGGVNAGFRFNISRNGRWRLETSLGFGIYRLDYDIFVNDYNGLLVGRRQRTFYGIDNAAISICYTFDLRNRRVKKPSSESDL